MAAKAKTKPKSKAKPKAAPRRVKPLSSPPDDLLAAIKRLAPAAFVGGKLNAQRLAELAGAVDKGEEQGGNRYLFDWAGRNDAFRAMHEMPPLTLAPQPKESVNFNGARNLFLEGDNLEVMKLLRRSYAGKVKMIYIDPPYNTGNDFVYRDNFRDPYRAYLQQCGIADGNGKAKSSAAKETNGLNGNLHSRWLTMMYPRLLVARELMRDDGVIFASIDDNEVHHLRILLNLIFGEENFIASLPVISNLKGNNDEFGFAGTHEYALVYAKDKTECKVGEFEVTDEDLGDWQEDEIGFYKVGANLKGTGQNAPREKRQNLYFPVFVTPQGDVYVTDNDKPKAKKDAVLWPITHGKDMTWRWEKPKFQKSAGEVIVNRNGGDMQLYKKQRPLSGKPSKKPKTLFYKPEYSSGNGTAQMKELFNNRVFDNPKPLALIQDMISLIAEKDDVVLDFFAGSGTTAHAVMKLNAEDGGKRRFMAVQMSEPTPEKSEARKAGYKTVADIAKERIRRAGKKIAEAKNGDMFAKETDTGFKVFKLVKSALPRYEPPVIDPKNKKVTTKRWLAAMRKAAQAKITADDDALIAEILLMEGYPLDAKMEKIKCKYLPLYIISAERGGETQRFFVCLAEKVYPDLTWDLKQLMGGGEEKEVLICRESAIPDFTTGTNMMTHAIVKTI